MSLSQTLLTWRSLLFVAVLSVAALIRPEQALAALDALQTQQCKNAAKQIFNTSQCAAKPALFPASDTNGINSSLHEAQAEGFATDTCVGATPNSNYGSRALTFASKVCEIAQEQTGGCAEAANVYGCTMNDIQEWIAENNETQQPETNASDANGNTPPAVSDETIANAQSPEAANHQKDLSEIQGSLARDCIGCPVVARIFAASMLYGEETFTLLGQGVVRVLGIAFALWLLYQGAQLFNPFTPAGKTSNLANTVFIRLVLVLFVTLALTRDAPYQFFWGYIYKPVVYTAIEFVNQLNHIGTGGDGGEFLSKGALAGVASQEDCTPEHTYTTITQLDAEQVAMKEKLECAVHDIQRVFTYGWAAGVWLFQRGNWVAGSVLTLAYILPPLIFVVFVIDAVVRWTFISVLSPAFMAAYAFPKTRGVSIAALKGLIESGITLACAGIVAVLVSGMIEGALKVASNRLQEIHLPEWAENSPSAQTVIDGAIGVSDPTQDDNLSGEKHGDTYYDAPLLNTAGVLPSSPVPGCPVTSPFGMRFHPVLGYNRLHNGTDFGCFGGGPDKPVFAAHDGIISHHYEGGCGNYSVVKNPNNNWSTTYCHTIPTVPAGSQLSAGQQLGYIAPGRNGTSTAPHLHFIVRSPDGTPVDGQAALSGANIPDGVVTAFGGTYEVGNNLLSQMPDFDMRAMEYWLLLLPAFFALAGFKGSMAEAQRMLSGSGMVMGLGTAIFAGASTTFASTATGAGAALKGGGNIIASRMNGKNKDDKGGSRDPFEVALSGEQEREWKTAADFTPEEKEAFDNWEDSDLPEKPGIGESLRDGVVGAATSAYEAIRQTGHAGDNKMDAVRAGIITGTVGAIGAVRQIPEGIRQSAENAVQRVHDLPDKVAAAITSRVKSAVDTVIHLPGNTVSALQELPGNVRNAVRDKLAQTSDDFQRWKENDAALDILTGSGKLATGLIAGSGIVAGYALRKAADVSGVDVDDDAFVDMRDAFRQGYNLADGKAIERERSERPDTMDYDSLGYREKEAATYLTHEAVRYQALAARENARVYLGEQSVEEGTANAAIYNTAAEEYRRKVETILAGGVAARQLVNSLQQLKRDYDYKALTANQKRTTEVLADTILTEGRVAGDMDSRGYDSRIVESAQGIKVVFGDMVDSRELKNARDIQTSMPAVSAASGSLILKTAAQLEQQEQQPAAALLKNASTEKTTIEEKRAVLERQWQANATTTDDDTVQSSAGAADTEDDTAVDTVVRDARAPSSDIPTPTAGADNSRRNQAKNDMHGAQGKLDDARQEEAAAKSRLATARQGGNPQEAVSATQELGTASSKRAQAQQKFNEKKTEHDALKV